jgi:hypothetical protein
LLRLFTDGWATQQAREQAAIIINRPAEKCPDASTEDRGVSGGQTPRKDGGI